MSGRDENGRFKNNKNTWSVIEDIAYCYLDNELLFFTDLSVYENIKHRSFCKLANGYSATHIDRKEVPVHRLIANPLPNELVDHINGNKKDNRACNLRNTNKCINAFNCKRKTTNTSGRTGVYYRKDTHRWTAEIKVNGKKIALGCYIKIEDAIVARTNAEIKYYGEVKRDE